MLFKSLILSYTHTHTHTRARARARIYIHIYRILQPFQFTNLSRFLVFFFNYLTILPIFSLNSLTLLLNSLLYPHHLRVHR